MGKPVTPLWHHKTSLLHWPRVVWQPNTLSPASTAVCHAVRNDLSHC